MMNVRDINGGVQYLGGYHLLKFELCEDQGIRGKLKKNLLANMCLRSLRSLRLIRRPGFKFESCSENVKQKRFQIF